MRLDEVARELYAAPPDRFVAARNEYARQAREAGDRKLADALRKLRRPTQSAWLVNLLLRERRALVDELLDMGAEFRGEPLTRDRLHELSTRRRDLLHRLQADAAQLSAAAGVPLTADRAQEVEATLAAAVADPDAAEQVRAGRLTTPLSYSGLGPELRFVPEERAAPEQAAAQRAATEKAAARVVKERTEAWKDAVRQRDGLARRREELDAELRRIQQRLDRVESDLAEADREVQNAADALEQTRQAAGPPVPGPTI